MNFLGHEFSFWATTIAAILLKAMFSRARSVWSSVISAAAGLFFAYVFTNPFLDYWGYDPDTYKVATAVALSWTGEMIMRAIVNVCEDPNQLREWVKAWRGK
jgi:small neutral amino acid transporter SnatA (MarC family)